MRLVNSHRCFCVLVGLLFVSLAACVPLLAQQTPSGNSSPQSAPASNSQQKTSGQAAPQPGALTPGPENQSGSQGKEPIGTTSGGGFVFHAEAQEVILHATVVDHKQRLIMNLPQAAFTVYEDGKPQTITSFRHEDVPVAMGIIIDNSGSMREKRAKVNAAALNLVRASNPGDEVFVVNFNDEYYLDQDFTSNIKLLKTALDKVEARGGTALYDAIVASADYMKQHAKLQKKVLIVVTDGEDNASRETLEQAVERLAQENGPTVYTIGLLGDESARKARRALEIISEHTGGITFLPKTLDQVDEISSTIAHDIRNQYMIGYRPSTPSTETGYRTIHVIAKEKGYKGLVVRTRTGYYPGQEQASNQ